MKIILFLILAAAPFSFIFLVPREYTVENEPKAASIDVTEPIVAEKMDRGDVLTDRPDTLPTKKEEAPTVPFFEPKLAPEVPAVIPEVIPEPVPEILIPAIEEDPRIQEITDLTYEIETLNAERLVLVAEATEKAKAGGGSKDHIAAYISSFVRTATASIDIKLKELREKRAALSIEVCGDSICAFIDGQ